MSEKLKVKSFTMTCSASPSQWDVYLDDGTYIYVRYRWGYFSARYGVDWESDVIYEDQIGDGFEGLMSSEEMINILSEILDFSEAEELP